MANAALVVEDIAATTPVSSRPVPAAAPAAEPDKVEANGLMLNDAISCLTRWDVRFVRRFAAAPSQSGALDPVGRYYAFIDGPDVVLWRRLTDDQVVHRWHCEGNIRMSLAVSPNGRYVYTYCKDARQRLKLYCYVWDSITGSLVLQRPIFSGIVPSARTARCWLSLRPTDRSPCAIWRIGGTSRPCVPSFARKI